MIKAWPKEEITFNNHMNSWGQGINHLSDQPLPMSMYLLYVIEFSVGLPPLGDN